MQRHQYEAALMQPCTITSRKGSSDPVAGPGTRREATFVASPWGSENEKGLFCYECHEELLHNPVVLPEDIAKFARLVHLRGLSETNKPVGRYLLAGRIVLFHEVIAKGLDSLGGPVPSGGCSIPNSER